jgi:FkbM family methyltransferase
MSTNECVEIPHRQRHAQIVKGFAMEKEQIYEILDRAYFSEHPDEELVLQKLDCLLDGVRHFVDIGASLGQFTLHANRILEGARIDSVEADPVRFERLVENCQKWSAGGRNVIMTHHAAVAKTDGEITFFLTDSNVSGGLFPHSLDHVDEQVSASVNWKPVKVPALSLDEFFDKVTPDFIKMDIEGAEGDALQGARRLLRRRNTRWLIELHGFQGGWSPQQVIELMKSEGYRPEEIATGRVLFTPVDLWGLLESKARAASRSVKRIVNG